MEPLVSSLTQAHGARASITLHDVVIADASMRFDNYALQGRIVPALFTIIVPVMVFNHFYVSEEFSKFVGGVLGAKIISNVTISAVCLYYLSEAGRLLGKHIFERAYYRGELTMPTTTLLTFGDNTYSKDYKKRIRRKIDHDFGLKLPTEREEATNQDLARVQIVETMALIRKRLHENHFLLQHNIEYGAARNAIGGAPLGALFSGFNIVIFRMWIPVPTAVSISVVTLSVYLLLIALSKIIMDFYGRSYAKVLYREYMGATKPAGESRPAKNPAGPPRA